MRKKVVIVIAIMLVSLMVFAGCGNISEGKDYTIPLIDLENKPEGLDPKYVPLFTCIYNHSTNICMICNNYIT